MTFTLDDVMAVVNELDLTQTNPSPGCVYTGPDGSHCIAGEICVKLGIDVPKWDSALNTNLLGSPNSKEFLVTPMRYKFTPEAAGFIANCQSAADDNFTVWSDAVDFAVTSFSTEGIGDS